MDGHFKGKTALVTGVGKGIGRAIAIALINAGAVVHGISRTQADLDSLKQEVPDIQVYNVDLSDWDKTRSVVQSMGPIDLLVNNAGIGPHKIFFETSKEDLFSMFQINVYAAFNVSQVVAQGMVDQGQGGSIVNVSSAAGIKPYNPVYSMSKAALDMLTRCMALELGKHQIRVNSINPTAVRTNLWQRVVDNIPNIEEFVISQTPMGRIAELDEVVSNTLFLLSDKASMITGTRLPIDGGLTAV